MTCDHKCHAVGLNPWVVECPICGCPNKDYDETIPAPRTIDELLNWRPRNERGG